MRKFWIFCIATLMVLGCNKRDTEVNSKLPEDKTKSEVVSQVDPEEKKMAEERTGRPAGASNIDPVLKDYEYPAAHFDGTFSMGNIVSVSYFSQDDFSKVVDFYNHKLPGTAIQSGTTTNFSKNSPDGSHISATISQVGDKTQIILKLERRRSNIEERSRKK